MECAGNGRSFTHPLDLRAVVPGGDRGLRVHRDPLRPILEEAGLLDDAVEVVFTGHDDGIDLGVHHTSSGPCVDEAMLDGVILAWSPTANRCPRARVPAALVVPTWYGMASVKWLKAITVIDHPFQGVQQKLVYRMTFSGARCRAADPEEVGARGDEAPGSRT